jgi:hypothetical protein
MNMDAFIRSLQQEQPNAAWTPYLKALWFDGKGDWEEAHTVVQDLNTTEAAHIHAYLHRKEGDAGNAAYWYHRAGKPVPQAMLSDEWNELVKIHLDR